MDAKNQNQKGDKRHPKPLLSHSTILILSAILIGLLVNHLLPAEFELYLYCGGAVGLLAYLGLDIVAARRREQEEARAQEQVERNFDSKMNRHISNMPKTRHTTGHTTSTHHQPDTRNQPKTKTAQPI